MGRRIADRHLATLLGVDGLLEPPLYAYTRFPSEQARNRRPTRDDLSMALRKAVPVDGSSAASVSGNDSKRPGDRWIRDCGQALAFVLASIKNAPRFMKVPSLILAVTLVAAALSSCTQDRRAGDVRIDVDKPEALFDEPIHIRVTGLPANEHVSITARASDMFGGAWSSRATFVANAKGELDLARDASTAGSYEGVDAMGLFTFMAPDSAKHEYFFAFPPEGAGVLISVGSGNEILARRTVVRRSTSQGVTSDDLRPDDVGFYGRFVAPPSTGGMHTAVLVFGGSEGGLGVAQLAGLLASHEFPTLALAYFGEPGLPGRLSRIPLEYFARALRWLARQQGVDPQRLVVWGGSRGAEAAMLVGAHFQALVHGVIAMSPSNVAGCSTPTCDGPAWTLRGGAVPYITQHGPDDWGHPEAVIPVERINGPILLACGGVDLVWPSCPMADAIVDRLERHRTSAAHGLLRFPVAGHGIFYPVPFQPLRLLGSEGVTREANAHAQARVWPAILRFLTQTF